MNRHLYVIVQYYPHLIIFPPQTLDTTHRGSVTIQSMWYEAQAVLTPLLNYTCERYLCLGLKAV